jgi:uncharacterized membrane protein
MFRFSAKLKKNSRLFVSTNPMSGVEKFFLFILIPFGIFIVFATPYNAGFDEEAHFVRVWQLSKFSINPTNPVPYPKIFHDPTYRRLAIIRPVEENFWDKYGQIQFDEFGFVYDKITMAIYAPPLFLPQAIVMMVFGHFFHFPAMVVFYLCRLAGLFSYGMLAWLGIRLIPWGKWILAILALSPMAVFQAATVSADSISNGIGFFFVGCVLAIANKKDIAWKDFGYLAVSISILFLAKLNLIFLGLLPLLILSPKKFRIKNGYFYLLAVTLILGGIEVLGWNIYANSQFQIGAGEASPIDQIRFIFAHPIQFIATLFKHSFGKFWEYYTEWAGVYGHNYWQVPKFTYIFFPLGLFAALFSNHSDHNISPKNRLSLILVALLGLGASIIPFYLLLTPIGATHIYGVQGRYFVPILPSFFLAFAGLSKTKYQVFQKLSLALAVITLLSFLIGLYLSYNVVCGTKFYETGLCYQPYYKNWTPGELTSPSLSQKLTIKQEIIPECNGVSQIRVWTTSHQSDVNYQTTFLLRNITNDQILLNETIENKTIPKADWLALNFPADWDALGSEYHFTISSDQPSDDNNGVQVGYNIKPEYKLGKLFENDEVVYYDLFFQYGCMAGIEKLINFNDYGR